MTDKTTTGSSAPSADRDDELDAALAELGDDFPPSDALMQRVLADADEVQAQFLARKLRDAAGLRARPPARPGLLARLMGVIGGTAGLATLGVASMTGLFLGFADPLRLDVLTTLAGQEDTAELDPLLGLDWAFDGEISF
jgi:predicted lipid-binding transport protein (Tim44 family)